LDPKNLTLAELLSELDKPEAHVRRWIAAGLPWHSKPPRKRFSDSAARFDADLCFEWLVDNGHIRQPGVRVETVADLARRWDVTDARIYQFCRAGMPRNEDGSFDLDSVDAWRAARSAKNGAGSAPPSERSQAETELARIRVEEARIDLEIKRGNLVDKDLPLKIIAAQNAEAIEHIMQMPDYFVALINDLPADDRRRIREACIRKVEQIRGIMRDTLRAWAIEARAGADPFSEAPA
jgi:hypothetical protein